MGDRSASIKIGLKAQGYVSGLRDIKSQTDRTGRDLGTSLKNGMNAGMRGAFESIKSGFQAVKTFVMGLGLFAGVIGIKEQVGHAIKMEASYRKLAFAIRSGTGEAIKWRDIQKDVHGLALETGQSTEALTEGYSTLFKEVGKAAFARQGIHAIATTATATGESIETLTAITGVLNEKFGVTADEIPETLAAVVSLGNKGGVTVEQMAEKLGIVGAAAKAAGLDGRQGFEKVVALLNVADKANGSLRKGISAVSGIIDTLGNKAERNKVLMKVGLNPSQVKGDATDVLGSILKKTGGNKDKLGIAFQGEQLKLVEDLGKTYATAFKETQGDIKTKGAAALAAYREKLEQAGKSQLSNADIQKQAAEEMQSTEKQIAVAMTKLEQTFSKPELTAAITKLANMLPGLAEGFGKLVTFATDNPLGAAGAGVAALGAKGFLEGAIGAIIRGAFTSGASAAAPTLASAIAGAGPGLAGTFGGMLGPIGLALGASLVAGVIIAQKEWKDAEDQRRATGKAAFEALDSDRQKINEALRQNGIQVDPLAGLSPSFARRTSANKGEGDAIEQAITDARMKGSTVDPATLERLRARYGAPDGGGASSGANASMPGPNQSTSPGAGVPHRTTPASQTLEQLLGRELKVRVVNPQEIGGGGSPGSFSSGAPKPGWMP
jgi:Phage-related minor tail protein